MTTTHLAVFFLQRASTCVAFTMSILLYITIYFTMPCHVTSLNTLNYESVMKVWHFTEVTLKLILFLVFCLFTLVTTFGLYFLHGNIFADSWHKSVVVLQFPSSVITYVLSLTHVWHFFKKNTLGLTYFLREYTFIICVLNLILSSSLCTCEKNELISQRTLTIYYSTEWTTDSTDKVYQQ